MKDSEKAGKCAGSTTLSDVLYYAANAFIISHALLSIIHWKTYPNLVMSTAALVVCARNIYVLWSIKSSQQKK